MKIKFRVWDIDKKEIDNSYESQDESNIDGIVEMGTVYGFRKYRLDMFTGKLDKNGKEIYENDRIKGTMVCHFPNSKEPNYEENLEGYVKFTSGAWFEIVCEDGEAETLGTLKNIEVIGVRE